MLDSIANWISKSWPKLDSNKVLARLLQTLIQFLLFGVWSVLVGGKIFTVANFPNWVMFGLILSGLALSCRFVEVFIPMLCHFSLSILIWLLYWGGDFSGAWYAWLASLDNAVDVFNDKLLPGLLFKSNPKKLPKCTPRLSNQNRW